MVKRQKWVHNKLEVLQSSCFDHGSKPEILSRIVQATAALTKLNPVWRDNNIIISWIEGEADVLSWHSHISVCL